MKRYLLILTLVAVAAVIYFLKEAPKDEQNLAQVTAQQTASASPIPTQPPITAIPTSKPILNSSTSPTPIPTSAPKPTTVPTAAPSVVPAAVSASLPAAPRAYVDTTMPVQNGKTIHVSANDDFQAALDQAQPGDTITLAAGATFTGPFTLPDKSGSGWIIIRTDAPDSKLPAPGKRIDPSYAPEMPKLVASSDSVIHTAPGAHNYRFIGVEIAPSSDTYLYEVVYLDSGSSVSAMPSHIIFDRDYIHGDPQKGSRHGVIMNSTQTAVIDSYVSDFKEAGADSQAIISWNGAGPFKISDDYLEAAGEDVLFGGADPSIQNLVPSDIQITGNFFSKQLAWKSEDWTVKNLLELKNARRVSISSNTFQYNWPQAQNGFSILFTVRNQDGSAPWSAVQDVSFTNNLIQHVGSGINILGYDDNNPSQQTQRILIQNNTFTDVGNSWGDGKLFQVLSGAAEVVINHNTADNSDSFLIADGKPNTGFVFTNNTVHNNQYGLVGTGTAPGTASLNTYFPGAVFSGNTIIGGNAANYPAGNSFPQ